MPFLPALKGPGFLAINRVIALVAFVLVERSRARAGRIVVLDLTLFAVPSFRNGNITAAPPVVALEQAWVDATRRVGLVAAGFVLLGLLSSLSLGTGKDTGSAAYEPGETERV
jgi:hypothetical protein